MAEQRVGGLITVLAASVGIVALVYVMFGRGDPQTVVAARKDVAGQQSLGVRAADADSARRLALDDAAAAEPQLPAVAPIMPIMPIMEVEQAQRRPVVEPTEPAVPIVPDAAALAAADAVMEVMPRVKADVEAAIESRRQAMRNACWSGAKVATATFPTEASFAADGTLLALSVADDRAAPEVGACVRAQPLPLKIEAPGVPITVKVGLTLP